MRRCDFIENNFVSFSFFFHCSNRIERAFTSRKRGKKRIIRKMSKAVSSTDCSLYRKVLLPHELQLLESGKLRDITHAKASSCILRAESARADVCASLFSPLLPQNICEAAAAAADAAASGASASSAGKCAVSSKNAFTTVYRPVGDVELSFLLERGVLPATQPYHAIMCEEAGREYAERYVYGTKSVDTKPSTVVEFLFPEQLISKLFSIQQKPEDGCLSHGLGSKAGNTLPMFNYWLQQFERTVKSRPETVERILQTARSSSSSTRQNSAFAASSSSAKDDDDSTVAADASCPLPETDFLESARAFRVVTVKRRL